MYPNVDKSLRIANYFKSESWGRNLQNIILISTPANMIYTIINLVITFNLLHRDVCMQLRGWEGEGERSGRWWSGEGGGGGGGGGGLDVLVNGAVSG